uniref:Stanniocalcin n=1 Tax=Fundulus heteroclitus TaxID=8078 RepID=A0A3Q2PWX4_FUNHE
MMVNVFAVMFLLLGCNQLLAMELHDHTLEKQGSQVKKRLSLQSTAEIQSCLVSSGDVGCGMFQCFTNNSCEIQGLHHICLTLLHNAGRYDSQGKSYVKDALRCMALGLRQRFSCVSRRCSAVKEMVLSLQRECYSKHNLCLAVQDHLDTMGNLVQFQLMFPAGPYVELMNFLLKCGDDIRTWVGRRLRGQCEQHWGSLSCVWGPDTSASGVAGSPSRRGWTVCLAPCLGPGPSAPDPGGSKNMASHDSPPLGSASLNTACMWVGGGGQRPDLYPEPQLVKFLFDLRVELGESGQRSRTIDDVLQITKT